MKSILEKVTKAAATLEMSFPSLESAQSMLSSKEKRCLIIGTPGSGKSHVARLLLDESESLLVNAFARSIPCRYIYGEIKCAICNGEKKPLSVLEDLQSEAKSLVIEMPSDILQRGSVVLDEIQEPEAIIRSGDDYALYSHLGIFDYAVIVINAQMAVTKSDLLWINYIRRMEIPSFVIVTKIDTLEPSEQSSVEEYIRSSIVEDEHVRILPIGDGKIIRENTQVIKQSIISSNGVNAAVREAQFTVLLDHVRSELEQRCTTLMEELDNQESCLKKQAEKAEQDFSESLIAWYEMRDAVSYRSKQTEGAVEQVVQSGKEKLAREIYHRLEMSTDMKKYCEVELPYILEHHFEIVSKEVCSVINQNLEAEFEEVQKQLRRREYFAEMTNLKFDCSIATEYVNVKSPDVVDTRRIRLYTRSGAVAVLLFAGVAFAGGAIGGAVALSSLLSGLGAEMWTRISTKQAQQKICEKIPSIVEEFALRLSLKSSELIHSEFAKIHLFLVNATAEYQEKGQKSLRENHSRDLGTIEERRAEIALVFKSI